MKTARLVNFGPFQPAVFAPRTAGFVGDCSFCPRATSARGSAEYMARSKRTGHWFSLCRHHATPYQLQSAGVNRRDVAAARAAIRNQFRRTS